jgi:hypothetical protein
MKKLTDFLDPFVRHPLAAPFALSVLGILAYGAHFGYLGVYWDDWPKLWVAQASGAEALRWLFLSRPLSGSFLSTALGLLGQNIGAWLWLALVLRIGVALVVMALFKRLWPGRSGLAFGVAALLVAWPGFRQQLIPISYVPHLLALLLMGVSMLFTVRSLAADERAGRFRFHAIALSLICLFTTEYFYGLELLRPLVIWLALAEGDRDWKRVARRWAPYGLALAAVFVWRALNAERGGYDIQLLVAAPLQALQDVGLALWGPWAQAVQALAGMQGRVLLYALALGGAAAGVVFVVAWRRGAERMQPRASFALIGIGLLTMLLGDIPARVADLQVGLAFPADRLTLPLMLGASLALAGLAGLFHPRALRAGLLAAFVGLAVAFHFGNALEFRDDAEAQAAVFQQLAWRAPGLAGGTTVLTQTLPTQFATDNSLTAVLNWVYAPEFGPPAVAYRLEQREAATVELPYLLRYLDLRAGWQLPPAGSGADFEVPNYSNLRFSGNATDTLLVYYQAPYCLQVLHAEYSAGHPHLLGAEFYAQHPDLLDEVFNPEFPQFAEETIEWLPYAGWAAIEPGAVTPELPPAMETGSAAEDWCYYFEQADLARQSGDWAAAAALGDQALELGLDARHASEWVPFIEAYAHIGNWGQAQALTERALQTDGAMQAMLCATWARVGASADPAAEIDAALDYLGCKEN